MTQPMSHQLQSYSFEDIADQLQKADAWLREMGFESQQDRFRQTIKVLNESLAVIRSPREPGEPIRFSNAQEYYFGLVDALDLRDVYCAFCNEDASSIRPILAKAIKGASIPPRESKSNALGRNTMFQLALAAEWKLRGAVVQLGEPDISIDCGSVVFQVECKRPWASHSVRPNMKDAAEQLSRHFGRAEGTSQFGAIAVSVSRILNGGMNLLIAKNSDSLHSLRTQTEVLYGSESPRWRRSWFHDRIVAVNFQASVVAVVDGKVYRAGHSLLAPIGEIGAGYMQLSQEMDRLYAPSTMRQLAATLSSS